MLFKLHTSNGIKTAFTLAEVLVTLGIIGTVAAITLPSVIQNYKKKEATTRLKKFNSMMSQAIMMSEQENGDASTWIDIDVQSYFNKYISKYIKYVKTQKIDNSNYKVYFADGTSVLIHYGGCQDFRFDINGDRNPNSSGRDIFIFLSSCHDQQNVNYWCKGKKWCTYGTHYKNSDIKNKCKDEPGACARFLELNNWEFPKDYPQRL